MKKLLFVLMMLVPGIGMAQIIKSDVVNSYDGSRMITTSAVRLTKCATVHFVTVVRKNRPMTTLCLYAGRNSAFTVLKGSTLTIRTKEGNTRKLFADAMQFSEVSNNPDWPKFVVTAFYKVDLDFFKDETITDMTMQTRDSAIDILNIEAKASDKMRKCFEMIEKELEE
jgi:hypothetical protein